jgi:hypothetical protein
MSDYSGIAHIQFIHIEQQLQAVGLAAERHWMPADVLEAEEAAWDAPAREPWHGLLDYYGYHAPSGAWYFVAAGSSSATSRPKSRPPPTCG